MYSTIAVCLGILSTFHLTNGQLVAEISSTKLPTRMSYPALFYDQINSPDTLLLFGGYDGYFDLRTILEFNFEAESVNKVGLMPAGAHGGRIHRLEDGEYVIFGAGEVATNIYKFSINDTEDDAEKLNAPYLAYAGTAERNKSIIVFKGNDVLKFDTERLEFEVNVTSLPFYISMVTPITINNTAFLFGSTFESGDYPILLVDLDTLKIQTGPIYNNKTMWYSKGIFDGSYIYLISGYYSAETSFSGLYRIDPITMEITTIPVANFPVQDGEYYQSPPDVFYAEHLQRIYFFGGRTNFNQKDDIWYVDLPSSNTPTVPESTTTPTTTPVVSTTDDPVGWVCPEDYVGSVAHPYVCHLFYICNPGHRPCLFECPENLVYNPENLQCDYVYNVPGCEDGKPGDKGDIEFKSLHYSSRLSSFNFTQDEPCKTIFKALYK